MSQIAVNRTSKFVLALFANERLRGRNVERCRLAMCRYRSSIECTSIWPPQSSTTTSSVPYVILQLAFPSSDPKKQSNHNHHGPCFLFLQDPPFFLFYFFFCNSQRKTKSIYRKSLALSTPVRNRLLLRSRNRGPSWQVPYGLTKACGGEFKVDVGEQTNSEVKKQNKKQSQFLLQPITTTNKPITNAYRSKIDTDSVVLVNLWIVHHLLQTVTPILLVLVLLLRLRRTSLPELVTSGLDPHCLVFVIYGMGLPKWSGNFFSAANFKGAYKSLSESRWQMTHLFLSGKLQPTTFGPIALRQSMAWHVLSSGVPVTFPSLKPGPNGVLCVTRVCFL
jgi:hypothetical protein